MQELSAWLAAHGSSLTEALGFVTGVVNVYLVTRERIWSWPIGVANAVFYALVFWRAGLYSDTGLQVVYFVLSLYGWWHWLRGATVRGATVRGATVRGATVVVATTHPDPTSAPLAVTRVSPRAIAVLGAVGVTLWLLVYSITSRIPGSRLPLLDAALAVGSLLAQWMMTRKLLESWALWILLDSVYVGVFLVRDLKLTALLYAVFFALAILGHIQWKRSFVRSSRASS